MTTYKKLQATIVYNEISYSLVYESDYSSDDYSLEWHVNNKYQLTAVIVRGLRPLQVKKVISINNYNFIPDERINTIRLLGKPSLGQSPPTVYVISFKCRIFNLNPIFFQIK